MCPGPTAAPVPPFLPISVFQPNFKLASWREQFSFLVSSLLKVNDTGVCSIALLCVLSFFLPTQNLCGCRCSQEISCVPLQELLEDESNQLFFGEVGKQMVIGLMTKAEKVGSLYKN